MTTFASRLLCWLPLYWLLFAAALPSIAWGYGSEIRVSIDYDEHSLPNVDYDSDLALPENENEMRAGGDRAFFAQNADFVAAKSGVWSLGPGPRGLAIESQLGGNLPAGFRVIDRFENGVATSIKSIDLNAATYQNAQALGSRLNGYVDSLAGWTGQTTPYGGVVIQPGQVTARTLQVAVPPGSMSAAQQAVFNAAAQRAQGAGINFIVTPVP